MTFDKNQLQNSLKELAKSIFWPAAAGNVFWALFSVWLDSDPMDGPAAPRVVLLLTAAVYLSINWRRQHGPGSKIEEHATLRFWVLDWLHLLAIVFTVNVAHFAPEHLLLAVTIQFGVTVAGHFIGFWELPNDVPWKRYLLAFINGIGILALYTLGKIGVPEIWVVPVSFGMVLVLWILSRPNETLAYFGVTFQGSDSE